MSIMNGIPQEAVLGLAFLNNSNQKFSVPAPGIAPNQTGCGCRNSNGENLSSCDPGGCGCTISDGCCGDVTNTTSPIPRKEAEQEKGCCSKK